MAQLTFGPLRTRDTPKQSRAVERVHLILQTTANLLSQVTPNELSTTMIAERADIPVSSIYRYFPSLNDVLRELYLQTAGELREKLFLVFENTETHPTWRDRLTEALHIQRTYLARHPFYRQLLVLFLVQRGTVAIEDEDHDELASFLRTRWENGGDGFSGGDPAVVANTTVQVALAMEDFTASQRDRETSRPYSVEAIKLLEGYLANYLSD